MTTDARRRWAFATLVALQAAACVVLIAGRRIPRGHDTLQAYAMQYLVLGGAPSTDGVALWLPGVSQGSPSGATLAAQGGVMHGLLSLASPVLRGWNFQPLFCLATLGDELLLLVGLWLLARQRYRSLPAIVFVAGAAAGFSWLDQIYFNLRLIAAVPLVLYFFHAFLETGRRRWLLLGGNLLALQALGNPLYAPIFIGFAGFVYAAGYVWVQRRRFRREVAALRPTWRDGLLPVVLLPVFAAVYVLVFGDPSGGVLAVRERSPDGSVPLDSFLTYGGSLSPLRYLDLVLGLSPSLDGSLFTGTLTLGFAAVALVASPRRRTLHLAAVIAVLGLFTVGYLSCVAPVGYAAFPLMKYFRHVGLTAPAVKLFLVLLAGDGVDALGRRGSKGRGLLLAVSVAGVAGSAIPLLGGEEARRFVADLILTSRHTGTENLVALRPGPLLAGFAIAFALALAATVVLRVGRRASTVVALLVVAHLVQLTAWRVKMIRERTVPLSAEQMAEQKLGPPAWAPRRSTTPEATARGRTLLPLFVDPAAYPGRGSYGAVYQTAEAYCGAEVPSSRFLTGGWSMPLDDLMRAYTRQTLGGRDPLACSDGPYLRFPLGEASAGKLCGVTADKLRVFSAAHSASGRQELASILGDPRYAGDLLFLLGGEGTPWKGGALDADEQVEARVEVTEFDANRLVVNVRTAAPAWLAYAEVWHPFWRATVNGAPARVERAQLAYQAVNVNAGENRVEFRFTAPGALWSYRLLTLNAALWVTGVLGWILRELCAGGPAKGLTTGVGALNVRLDP